MPATAPHAGLPVGQQHQLASLQVAVLGSSCCGQRRDADLVVARAGW